MTIKPLLLAVLAVSALTTYPLANASGQAAPTAATKATGRIVGKVLSPSGLPVPGARITVQGTTLAVSSAVDGRYTVLDVPPGTVELQVRRIGYRPKVISGIEVRAGAAVGQDIALEAEVFQLEAITVTAMAERGTVNQALDEQRNAPIIMSSATADQIAKSPDSDAGQAVRRVSGVTVQDDKYVFVRGLGERYTTTSLNSARIPSPEPERKVVPLDLFPSSLLESITTSKTFTPEQPGDFSGASVNLKTREFPLGRKITFNSSVGYNSAATGRAMTKAPSVGHEWLGLAGSARKIPVSLGNGGLIGKTPAELNQITASFRNVWSAARGDGLPNSSFGLSVGGEDPIFRQPIGYLASFTYSYGDEIRAGERRALAAAINNNGDTRPQNAYVGSTGTTSVLWGGLLNLSTRIGASTKISSSNTYTRSADNAATSLAGLNEEFATNFDITRLTYTERTVRSNQLSGEHIFGGRHKIDWTGSAAGVRRYEPDRSDLAYVANVDTAAGIVQPLQWFGGTRSATRTFSDLHENAYDGALNYRLALGASRNTAIKIGGLYRKADRDAVSLAYDLFNLGLSDAERQGPAESVLSPAHALAGSFFLNENATSGRYTAADRLYAGYAQFELPLLPQVRLIGGARLERSQLNVHTTSVSGVDTTARLNLTDVLPALALQIKLTQSQNLRFSASQTLSRPEYRELSPVGYLDILGGLTVFGNPDLKRALIQNYDARWELYPGSGQAIAIGVFAKRFKNPIEKVIVGQTGADALQFVNAEAANNYGIELELRKNLGSFGEVLQPFTVFANTTLMRSRIRTGNSGISSLTNANRAMVGQSGYVVNAGLGYARGGLSATALYNVVGRRIVEAGSFPRPDAYEEARHLLDVSVEFPLIRTLSAKLNARNLLDSPYRNTQGAVERLRYRSGRGFSVGFSWTPTGAIR